MNGKDVAVHALGPAGEMAKVSDGFGDIDHLRELQRFAIVKRLELRQFVAVRLDQVGQPVDQPGALRRGHFRPGAALQGISSGLDGPIDVRCAGLGDRRDRLTGGGVEGFECPPIGGRLALAADQQLVLAGRKIPRGLG